MDAANSPIDTTNSRRYTRLTIVRKIIVGYSAMALFSIAALAFSINGLVSLHRTAKEIARTDLVFISNLQRLRESLVAQERYAGKYLILGSDEFRDFFNSRTQEFRNILQLMQREKSIPELPILSEHYSKYLSASKEVFSNRAIDSKPMQTAGMQTLASIDAISVNEQKRLNAKLEDADRREESTLNLTLILSFTGFLLATAVAVFITYSISSAIRKLKTATHRIAEGEFDYDPNIPGGDEIGDLARDFTHMAERLKELEKMSLDASPLTRLPGNIAIERALNKLLTSDEQFAVCYADLDNFKAYNDRYGYIKGSELIKLTGEIIYEEAARHGGIDTFVGHVGGDDFVLILATENFAQVCDAITARFDREIVAHYSAEDIARGAIEGKDRYGVQRSFPIMSISIAVLVCQQGEYDSAVDIAKAAAQIKDHVKVQPGSNYFVNRRRINR
ncbi:RNase II stability modulator [Geobacter sp. OR-1]|uniref:HAMP domain-containing protein n=1 Tax=Geobacter sp. OR-1 TaxID=1266765 RepID=UPI000542DD6A|nr:HAMP domain-containing protein [Geobacter sp. OR-1]GAM11598.1 RNase II stability modulator [Geobacter sp. OR-1]